MLTRPIDSQPDVSIVLVTYNSGADLRIALEAALDQRGVATDVWVVDNASVDDTRDVVADFGASLHLLRQAENLGFAAAANVGIDASSGRYVLLLNPDCRLHPDFALTLVDWLDAHPDAASATGRLLRGDGPRLEPDGLLDSTGMRLTASGRHFDRGAGETARGRYLITEEVFGATGAAAMYRREALERARISTGYFDSDFFVYREDADLAWRLRRLGWTCWYVPDAVGWHRRHNLPERRSAMSPEINRHSVKNRFQLRTNNQTASGFVVTFVPTIVRDLVVLAACLTIERSSLPAFDWLWKHRARLRAKRREVSRLASTPEARARRRGVAAIAAPSPGTARQPARPTSGDPLVSVCVPTYQGGRFLREALQSVIAQTYEHIEILVVDGGSTDDTLAIASTTGDRRVRVIEGSSDGMVPNWNRSLREARGAYVKFLFQDDLLEPACVEEMVRALVRHPSAGLAFCPRTVVASDPADPVAAAWLDRHLDVHRNLGPLDELNRGRALTMAHARTGFQVNWIGEPTSVMVATGQLARLGTFNRAMSQLVDAELWLRILYSSDACFIDRPLATFRLHRDAATSSNFKSGRGWLDSLWTIEGLLRHPDLTDADRAAFEAERRTSARVTLRRELGRLRRGNDPSLGAHAADVAAYVRYRRSVAAGRPPEIHGSLA